MLSPILVAAFGRIAASKEHSLTQLHLRETLERGELFLLMASHFQKHESSRGESDFQCIVHACRVCYKAATDL